ncbi:elongation factor 4, partial [Candidatus Sumerlaeota bacterium]|nr:elongation factor 4 [Candidatus Sumerlaeota bacterium]
YQLNLVDTPGHVDFSYEVSRSMASCEGALLVVDAAQGVEAQTIANAYLAADGGLELIPVINKIDLPNADPAGAIAQIEEGVGIDCEGALLVSAKTGQGVPELLEAIVKRVPPPEEQEAENDRDHRGLRALIFDSTYDDYRGVIAYVRIAEGEVRRGEKVRYMQTSEEYEVLEVGCFSPKMTPLDALGAGEVGYIVAGIKNIAAVKVGDTVTLARRPASDPLPGYREIKPFVYCGLYPTASEAFGELGDAIQKIKLNDASFVTEKETSQALGFGYRCGFLGLLHMEIIQERLEREFDLDLVSTAPLVNYRITLKDGKELFVDNPAHLPDPSKVEVIEEPYIEGRILTPVEFTGSVMKLAQDKKGEQKSLQYLSTERLMLVYEFPLSEIIFDFYDKLKSTTKGYASFDYEMIGFRPAPMVKLDILINGDPVDALSVLVHHQDAQKRGRQLCEKLRKIVPRQLYQVAIQAAIGGKIIARETVHALRKDVTAKCYGGDISRKRKLLEKQKAGKKRMKQVGNVEIPQEAFMAVLRTDDK